MHTSSTLSRQRMTAFTDALWAVYKLRDMGRKPGRNDPCSCGSGKKYKKCCG